MRKETKSLFFLLCWQDLATAGLVHSQEIIRSSLMPCAPISVGTTFASSNARCLALCMTSPLRHKQRLSRC